MSSFQKKLQGFCKKKQEIMAHVQEKLIKTVPNKAQTLNRQNFESTILYMLQELKETIYKRGNYENNVSPNKDYQ